MPTACNTNGQRSLQPLHYSEWELLLKVTDSGINQSIKRD